MRRGWGVALLGVWLAAMPFFLASTRFYAWDNWIVGVIAGVLGFSMAARRPLDGWVAGFTGVWLFIAGFLGVFLINAGLWWNSVFCGLILLIIGIRTATQASHAVPPHAAGHSAA